LHPQYLGIDIAGAKNTWMCVLAEKDGRPTLTEAPSRETLEKIIKYIEEQPVVAAAIDAQLTWAPTEESGFRSSDEELRKMLPPECRNWVASQNSLMAVTVRGRQLAECISPTVGTIIETHPRACLFLANESVLDSIKLYKQKEGQEHVIRLWEVWTDQFDIDTALTTAELTEGALDAMICATIAYLFHSSPEKLLRLSHTAPDKRGRGPFFVLRPIGLSPTGIYRSHPCLQSGVFLAL